MLTNKLLFLSRMALCFGVFLCLTTCCSRSKVQKEDTDWVLGVYTVLAEKTMTLQADFNYTAWADMMSDDVVFVFPENKDSIPISVVGKEAVWAYWKSERDNNSIQSLSLRGFNHAPCQSDKKLNVTGLSGVHVFSLVSSQWVFTNGQTATIPINFCCHFNQDKRVDRCFLFYDHLPILKASNRLEPY